MVMAAGVAAYISFGSRAATRDTTPLTATADLRTDRATAVRTVQPAELDPQHLREARWLAVASGETPQFNQVSIEQDLGLAAEVLAGPGVTLFAAGPNKPTVQVLGEPTPVDPVASALADLFSPRGGRNASYRVPQIEVLAAATAENVAKAIRLATVPNPQPLLLYIAGHGHPAQDPTQTAVGFWGHSLLTSADFAALLEQSQREVQVVATTCFSGGLAEMVFEYNTAAPIVCGLFSAPADLESSGCDPNPDRASQEGFALHFLNALIQRDRDGRTIDPSTVDFDNSGGISLLEAHTYVRLHSRGPDVPTTTSQRWVEANDPGPGAASIPYELVENAALLAGLADHTGIDDPRVAQARLTALESDVAQHDQRMARAQEAEELAYRSVSAELLARWPVLDDPWHPHFGEMFAGDHDAIARALENSPHYGAYLGARAQVERWAQAMADLRVETAPLERFVRAAAFKAGVERMHAAGGPAWKRFESLLQCERTDPR